MVAPTYLSQRILLICYLLILDYSIFFNALYLKLAYFGMDKLLDSYILRATVYSYSCLSVPILLLICRGKKLNCWIWRYTLTFFSFRSVLVHWFFSWALFASEPHIWFLSLFSVFAWHGIYGTDITLCTKSSRALSCCLLIRTYAILRSCMLLVLVRTYAGCYPLVCFIHVFFCLFYVSVGLKNWNTLMKVWGLLLPCLC